MTKRRYCKYNSVITEQGDNQLTTLLEQDKAEQDKQQNIAKETVIRANPS